MGSLIPLHSQPPGHRRERVLVEYYSFPYLTQAFLSLFPYSILSTLAFFDFDTLSNNIRLHAAVTCSLDDSSFAVLARLPESSKLTESNETTLQSKDGAILLFNVGDPVPVATWFVEKVRSLLIFI